MSATKYAVSTLFFSIFSVEFWQHHPHFAHRTHDADMFFTTALLARAAKRTGFTRLTTKRAKKGYYKGKGAIAPGRHTKAGRGRGAWEG